MRQDTSATRTKIHEEITLACKLLKQSTGIAFRRPTLYLGDEYGDRFLEIASLKDLVRASFVLGIYDDENHGIFVPDRTWSEEDEAERMITFLHECVHALSVEVNQKLKHKYIDKLIRTRRRSSVERGYVYIAFAEGLAMYLSIKAARESGNAALLEKGQKLDKQMRDFFQEWITNQGFVMMAEMYEVDSKDWQKVLMRYLKGGPKTKGSLEAGLSYYKYDLGYRFMMAINSDQLGIRRIISCPPSTVEHLIYHETYMKALQAESRPCG